MKIRLVVKVKPCLRTGKALDFSFVSSLLLTFGVIFQIPLIFGLLGLIGLISSAFLRKNRKFAILIITIVAAILTPPDVISQILMAIPLVFLYEAGILLVRLTERQRSKQRLNGQE